MPTIEDEAEILQVSRYCEIIIQILAINKSLSLVKMLTFAFLLKNQVYLKQNLFPANTSVEIVYRYISALSGQFKEFLNNIPYILNAIHLLKSDNRITINNSIIKAIRIKMSLNQMYDESAFIYKVINESKKMTDRQFLKEVINNV